MLSRFRLYHMLYYNYRPFKYYKYIMNKIKYEETSLTSRVMSFAFSKAPTLIFLSKKLPTGDEEEETMAGPLSGVRRQ